MGTCPSISCHQIPSLGAKGTGEEEGQGNAIPGAGWIISHIPGMLSRSHGTPGVGLTPNHGSSFASSHILGGSGHHSRLGEGNPQVFGSCGLLWLCCWRSSSQDADGLLPPFACLALWECLAQPIRNSGCFPPGAQSTFPPDQNQPQELLQSRGLPAFPEGWDFGLCRNFTGSSVAAMKPSRFFASFLSPLLFSHPPDGLWSSLMSRHFHDGWIWTLRPGRIIRKPDLCACLGLGKRKQLHIHHFPCLWYLRAVLGLMEAEIIIFKCLVTSVAKTQGSEPLSLCHGTSTSRLCCSWRSRDLGSHPRLWEGGFALARKGLGVQDQGKREGNPTPRAGSP